MSNINAIFTCLLLASQNCNGNLLQFASCFDNLEMYNTFFSGILADELPVDEAAFHAAIMAINNAVDGTEPKATLRGMHNVYKFHFLDYWQFFKAFRGKKNFKNQSKFVRDRNKNIKCAPTSEKLPPRCF